MYSDKDRNKSEGTLLLWQLWENVASCSKEKGHYENSELHMNFQPSACQFLPISTTSCLSKVEKLLTKSEDKTFCVILRY